MFDGETTVDSDIPEREVESRSIGRISGVVRKFPFVKWFSEIGLLKYRNHVDKLKFLSALRDGFHPPRRRMPEIKGKAR